MGCTYRAITLIGIRMLKADLILGVKMVKAFEHDYPKDMNFCPKTARPLWTEEYTELFDPSEDDDFNGFEIITDGNQDGDYVWLAAASTDCRPGEHKMLNLVHQSEIEEDKQEIKSLLEPHNLWSDVIWGTWCVLYISC